MATSHKIIPLSGSAGGRGVVVAATATPGTTVHQSDNETTKVHQPTIVARNSHTSDVLLTLEWGGTSDPGDLMKFTIPADSEVELKIPGAAVLTGDGTNPRTIAAFAGTANVIVLWGQVVVETQT